jgi:hypothetical protein
MRKIIFVVMLVLGMASLASAQVCTMNDGIGTDKATYELDDYVCFTITLQAGSGCAGDITDANLYFFKPDNRPLNGIGCNEPEEGILV